ncbi:conserved hypothetical protein [Coccidioides posadasii str. Silveira]|uniref:Uncharacterized protein n=2 Tax=Coccidioides posadasii TaxID=199306 RepID=E9DAY6_COCPS|nr:conserved hypothetical protein [Coccidioides posadasii str. Silveira]KMM67000.1 hypothetical protein CPAG_03336 [Coccidioides posadasii RMSCC 3488]
MASQLATRLTFRGQHKSGIWRRGRALLWRNGARDSLVSAAGKPVSRPKPFWRHRSFGRGLQRSPLNRAYRSGDAGGTTLKCPAGYKGCDSPILYKRHICAH